MVSPYLKLVRKVEHLWQTDALDYISEEAVSCSKQDQQALALMQKTPTKVEVDGTLRHAIQLL